MKQTLADIRAALREADREGFEALARDLQADERKGVQQAIASARRRLDAEDAERARLEEMHAFQARLAEGGVAVGLDEVGRGPVAGPLTVAAVVLADDARIEGLNDSKQIKPERREEIAVEVKERAIAWAIEHIEPAFIDEHGMALSLRTAFSRARSRRSRPRACASTAFCSTATRWVWIRARSMWSKATPSALRSRPPRSLRRSSATA